MKDSKFNYFKQKVLKHLNTLIQKEEKDGKKKESKKSFGDYLQDVYKAMGRGHLVPKKVSVTNPKTGKTFQTTVYINPNKKNGKKIYHADSKGARISLGKLKKQCEKCTNSNELMQLILDNRERFSDENGRPLPIVQELSNYVSQLNDKMESAVKPTKAGSLRSLLKDRTKKEQKEILEKLAKQGGTKGKTARQVLKEDFGEVEKQKFSDDAVRRREIKKEIRRDSKNNENDKYKKLQEELKEEIASGKRNNTKELQEDVDEWKNLLAIATKKPGSYSKEQTEHFKEIIKIGEEELNRRNKKEDKEKKEVNETYKTLSDIRKHYETSKSITGRKKTVTLPNGDRIKCHYKLVEADTPTASHDEITFSPTQGFPQNENGKNINDRDYFNDRDAQESVRKIASNFNSLALESPPIVTKDGIVISGNNRTMSSKLAARNGTDTKYLSSLKEDIDEYGLDEDDLKEFKNPRLILEVDEEHKGKYTTDEFAVFNKDTKKTMNNVEKAVKLTKTLNADKIKSVADCVNEYETMGELYQDKKGGQRFVEELIKAGVIMDNEKAQYLTSDGLLNDTGKDFVETVLVGSVLNEDNIRGCDSAGGKKIRQKLVRAILPLIENKGNGKEYSFNNELNEAVSIALTVSKNHDTYPTVKTYLAQGTLFNEKKPDEITSKLAEIIHDEGEKAFASRMKGLGAGLRDSADGNMDIFLGGVETKDSLMRRFLDLKKAISEVMENLFYKEKSLQKTVADILRAI
jgi:hypothetical protein